MTTALRFIAIPLLLIGLFVTPAVANDLSTAKSVISKQIALIKKGDVAKLKKGFTARLQPRINSAMVKKAQGQIGEMTIDDLVAATSGHGDSIKIKMKNGRTLTTLVKVDGVWLADTLWFK
jgi:hypothetical protein